MGTANIDVSSEVALPRVPCPATSECQDDAAKCHESDECLCILENLHEFEVPDSCCENDNAYNEEYLQLDNWCEVPEGKDESDKTRAPLPVEAVSRSREVSPEPAPESDSMTTSMSTVKREGTFTLDDSPPAKITKSVTHR
ncbi:hypothetical protein Pcinc_021446 [Petrolisthes cinctipes]|uniref:Uncharacterized protein n=1 Tax=Petrolisthes cinctipes TaxID=88211 RepID=A0AAE1FH68_PETCI|nr:hypothetical protein Pcinc_021446 [Petrolisthes cinctipes]